MKATRNQLHPRMVKEGRLVPFPIFATDFGALLDAIKGEIKDVDDLGMATVLYFKLLKSLVKLFVLFSIISSPIYFIYSTGNMSLQASSLNKEYLSEYTIGNIGESAHLCHK